MNTRVLELIYSNNNFDWQSFTNENGRHLISKHVVIYSNFINYHPIFVKDINDVRNSLLINKLLVYPKEEYRKGKNILDLLENQKVVDKTKLDEQVNNLLVKYNLQEFWRVSLSLKILTDILPIPVDEGYFHFHHNAYDEKSKLTYKTNHNTNLFVNNLRKIREFSLALNIVQSHNFQNMAKYPAIFITSKISSKHKLIQWINENWKKVLKPTIYSLPIRRFNKINLDNFLLGTLIWARINNGQTWKDIDKFVDELQEKDPNFFGKEGHYLPDRIQQQKLINEIESVFRQFYPF